MRISPLDFNIGLGAYNEKRRGKFEAIEADEIDVGAIHDVERSGFGIELVEDIDVMHFSVGNANE